MLVEPFDYRKHALLLKGVFIRREMDDFKLSELPKNGFIATSARGFIAAAFLRLMEGNMALFDGLISDPSQEPQVRHAGLDAVAKALLGLADDLQLKTVLCYSLDANTIKRAESHGFIVMPHTFMAREIKGGS